MALSLAAVCLHVFGRPVSSIIERLAASLDRAEQQGNLLALAMALYACALPTHDAEALRV
jgi:hypothetical protein